MGKLLRASIADVRERALSARGVTHWASLADDLFLGASLSKNGQIARLIVNTKTGDLPQADFILCVMQCWRLINKSPSIDLNAVAWVFTWMPSQVDYYNQSIYPQDIRERVRDSIQLFAEARFQRLLGHDDQANEFLRDAMQITDNLIG